MKILKYLIKDCFTWFDIIVISFCAVYVKTTWVIVLVVILSIFIQGYLIGILKAWEKDNEKPN